MRTILAISLIALLPLISEAASFSDYPAEVASGPFVAPDFAGKAADYRSHRTRFTDGSAKAPDFAGKYVLVTIGCGTGCRFAGAVDRKTGAILDVPLGGEENMYLELYSRADSRLLKATWIEGYNPETCMIGEFVLEGEALRELGRRLLQPVEDCHRGPEG